MDDRVRRALETDRTIDITTTGRKTGVRRRTEIWFHNLDGRLFITGTPGTRSWYANLVADRDFTFHLKGSVDADIPARARLVQDAAERRQVLAGIFKKIDRGESELEDWVSGSPLIEVELQA